MKRTWQARLQQKHDIIKRKMIDNLIEHEGAPTDCIRIHLKKNDEGDITDRVVEKADIVSVIFPPLQDVPYRRVCFNNTTRKLELTSLPAMGNNEANDAFTITVPHKDVLLNGDLIIRVMIDPDVEMPIIIALEVLEPLGTFGGQMLIQSKFKCCLYNENLSDELLKVITEMAKRRLHLTF